MVHTETICYFFCAFTISNNYTGSHLLRYIEKMAPSECSTAPITVNYNASDVERRGMDVNIYTC